MHMLSCILLFYANKVVVGSGSECTSKYVGEGVTYGVFLGIICIFLHTSDMLRQIMRTLGYVIMMLHHEMMSCGTSMMSCHDIVMMS